MTEHLLREDEGGVATLTLNRPERLNALNVHMFETLDRHLSDIAGRLDKIGLVVLRGAGRSFCAGHDLDDLSSGSESVAALTFESHVVERLARLPQPVIGLIHGHCLTGGLELALAADILIAGESAKFADTHAKWDLQPFWGLSQRLPRRIGRAKALEMMLTCRTYSGREAEAMGLVNICVPDQALEATLEAWSREILANGWHANRGNKFLLNETDGMTLADGLAFEVYRSRGFGPELDERLKRMRKK